MTLTEVVGIKSSAVVGVGTALVEWLGNTSRTVTNQHSPDGRSGAGSLVFVLISRRVSHSTAVLLLLPLPRRRGYRSAPSLKLRSSRPKKTLRRQHRRQKQRLSRQAAIGREKLKEKIAYCSLRKLQSNAIEITGVGVFRFFLRSDVDFRPVSRHFLRDARVPALLRTVCRQ